MTARAKTEEARIRLLDEGIALFSEHGFHGIGLKELLSRVGIPKGSFYHYFESKEDFGARVVSHYADRFRSQLADLLNEKDGNALERIRHFVDRAAERFEDAGCLHGCLLGTLGAEISDTAEACRRTLASSFEALVGDFEAILAKGQTEGCVRRDIAASDLADLLVNSLEGALLRMKVDRSIVPLRQFRELVIDGLLPPRD